MRRKFEPQHIVYQLEEGFLFRPMLLAVVLGALGTFLSFIETRYPSFHRVVPEKLLPVNVDVSTAQNILGNIATAMMTVVSIVFAVLLMTLTLTSTQFSPRIIIAFVKDRVTQQTLGIYLGTFLYCLGALPFVRNTPQPFAPVVAVYGAIVLAVACVAWLLFFINHISRAVSVNHIVHKIARETEGMIARMMPRHSHGARMHPVQDAAALTKGIAVVSTISGYVRSISTQQLYRVAKRHKLCINVTRRVGHFVPMGVPLLMVSGAEKLSHTVEQDLIRAFYIGPTRTLEQDIEFGILQIVDIALKALSPAVNDPSTAITCIDQLSSILIHFSSRENPKTMFYEGDALRVIIPWQGFDRLLNSAFEQIRMYAKSDLATSLRLLRAFSDISITLKDKGSRELLLQHGRRLAEDFSNPSDEVALEMQNRIKTLEMLVKNSAK